MSAAGEKVASGLVPFPHLHEAMRTIAFVLSFGRGKPPTPFDEERAAAADAIRIALEHPMNAESVRALLTQRDALEAREKVLREALTEYDAAFTEFDADSKASRHRMRMAVIGARAALSPGEPQS